MRGLSRSHYPVETHARLGQRSRAKHQPLIVFAKQPARVLTNSGNFMPVRAVKVLRNLQGTSDNSCTKKRTIKTPLTYTSLIPFRSF